MKSKLLGYVFGILAAATYGMNPVFAVPLYENGMNAESVLLWRYALAIPVVAIMLIGRGRSLKISRIGDTGICQLLVQLAILGVLMGVSSLALFASYNYMNAGIASTLLFIYPVMVAVIMAVMFGERMSTLAVFAMLLALGGIMMLYRNPSGATLSLVGSLLVAVSALTYAIYIVAVNHLALKEMPTLLLTFYVLIFGTLVFVASFMTGTTLTVPSGWSQWGFCLGLAVFPTAISFLCTTRSIHIIGSTPTAVLGAFEPITAIVLGVVVLHQPISGREWLGAGMILVAVMITIASVPIGRFLNRLRHLWPRISSK